MRQFSAMSKAALGFISRRRQLPCIRHGSILGRDEIIGSNGGLDVLKRFGSVAGIGAKGLLNEENIVDKGILKWDVFSARVGAQQTRGFLGCGDGDEDSGLAKTYEEKRVIGYSPEQLFAVVAAVDLYEDFVPWCQRSVILRRKNDEAFDAELEIGFKFLVERYMSHVELKKPRYIKTSVSESSLFDYLINIWEFNDGPIRGTCDIHFFVDFQFRSPLYRQVANMFFKEVVSRLVYSFEQRCQTVYGPAVKLLEGAYGSR